MAATNTITIRIDTDGVFRALRSDRFGRFAASEWKRLIDPYTPMDTGALMGTFGNVQILPFKIWYRQPYAHYQYEGIAYVDPVYNVGGFYNPNYGWWSRPGVKKVPSGRHLQYQKKNPFATDHWDSKAEQAGKAEQLAQTLTTALQRGIF